MDLDEIRKLIDLMNENGLNRLEVEEEGRRYLLERGGQSDLAQPQGMVLAPAQPAPVESPAKSGAEEVEDTVTFNSPMVGTFYRASSPEAEPFVKPGDRITPDSVLCIIEAMKVFNEIRAEMSGTLIEVLAENSEAVEYNQPLFLIRPD